MRFLNKIGTVLWDCIVFVTYATLTVIAGTCILIALPFVYLYDFIYMLIFGENRGSFENIR